MTSRWTPPTTYTLLASGFAGMVTIATAAYLIAVYPSLPIGLPVQYVGDRPFVFQLKSPSVVMLPFIVQSALALVFGSLILLLLWRPRSIAPASSSHDEADRKRMSATAEGIALLASIWILIQALGAARLIILWRGAWGGYGDLYSVSMVLAVGSSIAIMVRTWRLLNCARAVERPDNPSLWRFKDLYFNPADPALFVQTRDGAGWTLNFGRPGAIAIMAATLMVGMGGPFVFARYVLRGFTLGIIG
jgi:uncharacterized membrane protein